MSGVSVRLIFALVATLAAVGVFFNGHRFARMDHNPLADKRILGLPVEGLQMTVPQMQKLGRFQMYLAPVVWLFMMAAAYLAEFDQ